ncbi:MAG: hypothetical protein QW059_06070 [Nitrososphaerota archaeon]
MAGEERVLRVVGYSLIGLALALVSAYLLMFFDPPSEAWRPLYLRLLVLASVAGMAVLIAWLGLTILPRRARIPQRS